jgi:ATP-dependent protease HslVU (ClpYQ) ATPase subunit
VLDILIPMPRQEFGVMQADEPESAARQNFRKKLREGQLAEREIEVEVAHTAPQLEIMGPAGMEEMTEQLRGMFGQLNQNKKADPQAQDCRCPQTAGRRRGRQTGQRGRHQDPGAAHAGAKRHCVH